MLSNTIMLIISLALLFYIPGRILLKRLKVQFPVLDRIVLSFALGLVITVQCYALAGLFRLEGFFLWALTIFSAVYFIFILINSLYKKRLPDTRPRLTNPAAWLFLMLLFLMALSYIAIMTSGRMHPDGMRFYGSNAFDAMCILSIAQEMTKPFPHMVPFWAGAPLTGYHIDSFYWLGLILRHSGIDAFKFYFNYMPLVLFPLLLFSVYICSRKIFGRAVAIAATFFALFMADMSWIFLILSRIFYIPNLAVVSFNGSVLPSLILTQPNIHAIIMLFCGLYFLKLAEDDPRMPIILTSALFFGLIVKYKSFYGIAVIAALIITALLSVFQKKKNAAVLKIAGASTAIFMVSALSMVKSSGPCAFVFTPGYYGILFLNNLKYALAIGTQDSVSEVVAGSLIFLLGSIGIKILALPAIFRDIRLWKGLSPSKVFIISVAAISFTLMNLVTLNTNYAYATSALYVIFQIVLGLYLGKYFTEFFQRHKSRLTTFILITVVTLGLGSTLFSVAEYIPPHPRYKFLNHQELAVISFLKQNTPPSAVILHNRGELSWYWLKTLSFLWDDPKEWKGRDCFISALTGRRVVAECAWYLDSLGYASDIAVREEDISEFFKTNDKNRALSILKKYKVDYVWVQPYQAIHFNINGILKDAFSGGGIKIYKVLP